MLEKLSPQSRKICMIAVALFFPLLGAGLLLSRQPLDDTALPVPVRRYAASVEQLNVPSQLAVWPWPGAVKDVPHSGVTHWLARDGDGTAVELFDFDFKANPRLRLEIFDQDQDDARPFDNKVQYVPRGVGQITRQLNAQRRGSIVAAWNGSFFGYDHKAGGDIAFHIAPVVLNGKVHDWGSNHRWTFGVKYQTGRPVFKALHLPKRATLGKEFDWAAGGVQCLRRDGVSLKLQPFPKAAQTLPKPPIKSTPRDAGHIPLFDHMKSCRVSLGWTRDSRHLYLLYVQEPDTESASILALLRGVPSGSAAGQGGWMVSDLQRFWETMQVPNAINSDAGGVAQLAYRRTDGKYELVAPRVGPNPRRMTFTTDFHNAPHGGAIMYFYVRDTAHGTG